MVICLGFDGIHLHTLSSVHCLNPSNSQHLFELLHDTSIIRIEQEHSEVFIIAGANHCGIKRRGRVHFKDIVLVL